MNSSPCWETRLEGVGEIRDLGKWVGDMGEYVPSCQVSLGLMAMGRWEMRKKH